MSQSAPNSAPQKPEDTPTTEDLFRQYVKSKDLALRDRLISRHMHLVQAVARRFAGMGESPEDLAQEGTMGLINAVDLFDVNRGVRFTTYATHLIGGQIQHYLRDKGKLIRQPAWIQELGGRISRTAEALTQKLKRAPTPAEIARALDIGEAAVRDSVRARERTKVTSLDVQREDEAEGGAGSGLDMEKIHGGQLTSLEMPIEDRILLEQAIEKLKDLERQVVRYFFFNDLNQTEIARKLGISVNYASYLLRGALGKLRATFETQTREPPSSTPPSPPAARGRVPMGPARPASLPADAAGVATPAYLHERLRQEVARARRYVQHFAVMLVQIDPPQEGEAVSDPEVLARVAAVLRPSVRSVDLVARLDTASLGLLLPHTGGEARVLGERLVERVRGCGLRHNGSDVTVSVGYAIYPGDGRAPEDLLTSARRAAAQACAQGGCCTCRAPRDARLRRR